MKKYYFTFGHNHLVPDTENFKDHPMTGRSLQRFYVTVEADTEQLARQLMFERYSDKWSFSYPENQYKDAIERFKLIEFERLVQVNPVKI